MQYLRISLLVAIAGLFPNAHAGAGANIKACLQMNQRPSQNFTVSFQAGASTDHCMNNQGVSNSVLVYKRGLTCASVGYVECKASSNNGDTCGTDKSWWGLSYNIPFVGSGSTNSRWYNSGKIELSSQTPGTWVCGAEAECRSTSQNWDGTGNLWIIFTPGYRDPVQQFAVTSGDEQQERILEVQNPEL